MIRKKTQKEIEILRQGGKILAKIMNELRKLVKSGISTYQLNEEAERLALLNKAKPSFKGYDSGGGIPYPCALCTSINDEVVHGIAGKNKTLQSGDIISLDMGIEYKGMFTDHAITLSVGRIKRPVAKLVKVTREALYKGIGVIRPGVYLDDISKAVQEYVEKNGFSVVRELVGHGVGHAVHEEPAVPNYYAPKLYPSIKLECGMVIAIEPMVNMGSWPVQTDADGWTVRTSDGSLSAHWEHTVAVVEDGYEILTQLSAKS